MQDREVLAEAGAPLHLPKALLSDENPLPLGHTLSSPSGADLSLQLLRDEFLLRTPASVCNVGAAPSKP